MNLPDFVLLIIRETEIYITSLEKTMLIVTVGENNYQEIHQDRCYVEKFLR